MPRLTRVRPGVGLGYRRLGAGTGFRYVDADGEALPASERERVVALVIPPAWREADEKELLRFLGQAQTVNRPNFHLDNRSNPGN